MTDSPRTVAVRVSAALFGTLPVAVLSGVVLARFLPLPVDVRLAIGLLAMLPVWVLGMCFGFLSRRPARAWAACAVISLLCGGALASWGAPPAEAQYSSVPLK